MNEDLVGAEARERQERESKRRRLLDDVPLSMRRPGVEQTDLQSRLMTDVPLSFRRPGAAASSSSAAAAPGLVEVEASIYADQLFEQNHSYYTAESVTKECLQFGLERDTFD